MRREEAIAKLKEAEPVIRARGAAALYLFGSHARDQARTDSDVDVFIDKDRTRKFGFDEFMDNAWATRWTMVPAKDSIRCSDPGSSGRPSRSSDEFTFAADLAD